jgi:hypothetical protein
LHCTKGANGTPESCAVLGVLHTGRGAPDADVPGPFLRKNVGINGEALFALGVRVVLVTIFTLVMVFALVTIFVLVLAINSPLDVPCADRVICSIPVILA